ncbi:MAG TPA: DUF433 domain-containing protein [Thermoanaerobaculia bacterium]|nr:DUF433 domain-containing protein [Thermoanaerobaculia bacterium]
MPTKQRTLQISDELDREISQESADRDKTWSDLATELLDEAIRMRRAPGVVFADGPTGRRAVVAGTGLDVWEVVATWRACSGDFDQLRRNYEWLTEPQLRAALAYYKLYPGEIDARLTREAEWTPERIRVELPFARPRTR